jgi:2-polyprenyl-6-methoxyphenol hydroxylase-like FAD-dependent oxidoreductase
MAPPFKVLIAGAGLGGVTLAILLEKAQIDYELFESAPQVSPLGKTKQTWFIFEPILLCPKRNPYGT